MQQPTVPPAESFAIRCPKLGTQISFSYCRRENEGLPCARTLDCWYVHFQVVVFLRQELTAEQWQKAFAAPTSPKMVSLAEMIEQAQKRVKKDG